MTIPTDPRSLTTIEDYLREYARLDEEATRLEEQAKDAARRRDVVETQIIEKYNMEGMSSSRVAGLGSFVMTTMTRASIKADQKDRAIALFKEYFPDLVQETVNAQTLSGFVNNAAKNQQDMPPELLETLNVFKKQYLSWKK